MSSVKLAMLLNYMKLCIHTSSLLHLDSILEGVEIGGTSQNEH